MSISTIDRAAVGQASANAVRADAHRADLVRAYRVHVYGSRLDRLRATGELRGMLTDPSATIITGEAPPVQSPGLCAFPGCPKPWKSARLCAGHHKQKERRGSWSAMTPLLPPNGPRAFDGTEAPCVRCGSNRIVRKGRRRWRECLDCAARRMAENHAKRKAVSA